MISLVSESFAYDDGVPLLAGVSLRVERGDHVVVVGASSSGKTTLARLLAGQTSADAGAVFRGSLTLGGDTVRFEGVPGDPRIDPAAWSARVGFVGQGAWGQLSMMSATVAEEIAFGPANRGVPRDELRALVDGVAAELGLSDLLDRDPRKLSGGQLQRTVIAATLAQRPAVLVLDEPFQGLDVDAAASIARALDALRADGTAVVVCEPMLPREAPADARVLALADGHAVFSGSLTEARWAGLRRYAIGTAGDPPTIPAGDPRRTPTADRELVALRGVGFSHPRPPRDDGGRPERSAGTPRGGAARTAGAARRVPVLTDVDLSVRAGEIVAIRGANGSGKSTLLHLLNGLCRAGTGIVVVAGSPILRQPTGSLATQVGHLFQDTDQQLFGRTVLREVAYGPLATGRRRSAAEEQAASALTRVGLGALAGIHPYELGFVQRRLVALASIMAIGPEIWTLDEPTAGLDEPTRSLMASLILDHARAGGAVVMATHDAAFAGAVADRELWLEGGTIRARRSSD